MRSVKVLSLLVTVACEAALPKIRAPKADRRSTHGEGQGDDVALPMPPAAASAKKS